MSMTGDRIEVLGEKNVIDEGSRDKEFFDEKGSIQVTSLNGSMKSNCFS